MPKVGHQMDRSYRQERDQLVVQRVRRDGMRPSVVAGRMGLKVKHVYAILAKVDKAGKKPKAKAGRKKTK